MITSNILFQQSSETKNEIAKRGIDIYFNSIEKTDSSIYSGIYPNYNSWRKSMIYFGSKLSASVKKELLETDLEIVRGNEPRVNFAGQDTTTDFAFVLNNYASKRPILIGVVSKGAKGFLYRSSKYNDKTKDYTDSVNQELSAKTTDELIQKVAVELNKEIAKFKS